MLINNNNTSATLIGPSTSGEMCLCSYSLFAFMPVQHGHRGMRGETLRGSSQQWQVLGAHWYAEACWERCGDRFTLGTNVGTHRSPGRWQCSGGCINTGASILTFMQQNKKLFTIVFIQIKYLRPLFFLLSPYFP